MRPPSFEQIATDLRSDQQETRGRAMQNLLLWTTKDPGIHSAALPLFQTILSTAQDSWTVTSAARGVELIQGTTEGRKAWLTLLNHSNDHIAAGAALSVDAVAYTSELMGMLATRPEPRIQIAVIRSLGRTKNPEFLATILRYLDQPETRTHAIMALEQLEDPRALASLEPLIHDNSDSGTTDDRGFPMRIGDLAWDATRRLQYVSGNKSNPSTKPPPPNQPVARPDSPFRQVPASRPQPVTPSPAESGPARNLLAFLPLAAAAIEIPWVAMIVFAQLFTTGAVAKTEAQTHRLDAFALIPPVIGLAAALYVVVRQPPQQRAETICLSIGSVVCGLFAFSFGWELLH